MDKKLIYYLSPLIILFIFSLHLFNFYQAEYKRNLFFSKSKLFTNNYQAIQKQHPYYEIYQLAKTTNNPAKKVIVIFTKKEPKNLDYTSTFFKHQSDDNKKKYLSELILFVNYFFYPRILPTYSFESFTKIPLTKLTSIDYIISDTNLKLIYKKYAYLKTEKISIKPFIKANRHPEDKYYIYRTKK